MEHSKALKKPVPNSLTEKATLANLMIMQMLAKHTGYYNFLKAKAKANGLDELSDHYQTILDEYTKDIHAFQQEILDIFQEQLPIQHNNDIDSDSNKVHKSPNKQIESEFNKYCSFCDKRENKCLERPSGDENVIILRYCKGCKKLNRNDRMWYCSRKCQKIHWKKCHREVCPSVFA